MKNRKFEILKYYTKIFSFREEKIYITSHTRLDQNNISELRKEILSVLYGAIFCITLTIHATTFLLQSLTSPFISKT